MAQLAARLKRMNYPSIHFSSAAVVLASVSFYSYQKNIFQKNNSLKCNDFFTTRCQCEGRNTTSSEKIIPIPSSFSIWRNKNDDGPVLIPMIEALIRATRLIQTVTCMVLDYKLANYEKSVRKFQMNLCEGLDSFWMSKKDSTERKRVCLEDEVSNLKAELQQAQLEYTTAPPISPASKKSQKELKEAVQTAAVSLEKAEAKLLEVGGSRSSLHYKAATRLLELCRKNKGVYIKVGQHLAQLDYLIPPEYIEVLSELFDSSPLSPYDEIRELVKQDLGMYPEQLFEKFSKTPIASASLAQVHVAFTKSGQKLALKVQHPGLRETSVGDLFALVCVVNVVETLFKDFSWGWLVDEIAPQLPRELDFKNEALNAEAAASHLKTTHLDCVIPKIQWEFTSSRVLCMDFEEGFRANDSKSIQNCGLDPRKIAKLISCVFNSQIFESGFVHCDPHPANVLLREHPSKKGQPQIVLVDHGLYKKLDDDFRINYAKLWKSIMVADVPGIKHSCEAFGIVGMYPLLAAMLTSRPFDEIVERSKISPFLLQKKSYFGDKAKIRGYAERFFLDIVQMLDTVPRQMLLLFKMNDCLRHIHTSLGSSPFQNIIISGKYASKALNQNKFNLTLDYIHTWMKIRIYDFLIWLNFL